ncbi:hypothetical protein VPNG_09286 [Cytospora leucostoma]|uniref:Cupin type-2 domain-containing protein n=1 Tax=Cytospora leucostoma TaxID=1230097 RepID=A0A423VV06_9PEZI|nr:hypothetical protein VPNG_09286 [Cytospora leucostoma]
MASLLPLLQDLLPMIIPSKVHIARDRELVAVPERVEIPSWYGHKPPANVSLGSSAEHQTDDGDVYDATSLPASQPEQEAELIRLVDHEECPVGQSTADHVLEGGGAISIGPRYCGHEPTSDAGATGPRVLRKDAIVGVTDSMCATVLLVKPRSASAIHHHGEQDAIIFAQSGYGVLLVSPSLEPVKAIKAGIKGEAPTREEEQARRYELSPGDFAFVPAWTEHQVLNEGDVGDVVWVVTRSGGEPVQVDLVGWGDARAKG